MIGWEYVDCRCQEEQEFVIVSPYEKATPECLVCS